MMILSRHVLQAVKIALERQATVALIGPRQVGKTTLALRVAKETNALYLDLETQADRKKLADPALFLRAYEDRLVILDEIHRTPDLFQELRGLIDRGRRSGRGTGRFLVLGSASMDLLKQSSESLAGRVEFVDLGPLNVLEVGDTEKDLQRLWLRGGFPGSYLPKDDADSLAFRQNLIRTLLERDVSQFGRRIPAEVLERLWMMLAHSQGTMTNYSKLASNLSVSSPTAKSYVSLLDGMLLVRRLAPHHANARKRLVKSPKAYIRDSGLVHALLGIGNRNELAGHPVVGQSWEGFVIENILAVAPAGTKASFYRTTAGAEIDLLLELPGGVGMWAIEIKLGVAAKPQKGFHMACQDLRPSKSFVVHSGEGRYPLKGPVEAVGLADMVSMIAGLR